MSLKLCGAKIVTFLSTTKYTIGGGGVLYTTERVFLALTLSEKCAAVVVMVVPSWSDWLSQIS